jgi:uncharacterized protein (TIGR00255 family)
MTGYAAGTREMPQGALVLELKSVNSRFLDISFRIADELRAAEPAFREAISAGVGRGKIDCRMAFNARTPGRGETRLDPEVLASLGRLQRDVLAQIPEAQPLRVSEVLHWPGIFGEDPDGGAALREAALALLTDAMRELDASRRREGDKLAQMIRERVDMIRTRLAALGPAIPQAIAAYEEKLAAKLREALGGGDEERIRQEIAVFGVKVDVAEEFSRLATHLDEVERTLAAGGAVGKRLDFLMQELNRETNTLGSKSVSREVSQAVLDFKLAIEQMREQVQNME